MYTEEDYQELHAEVYGLNEESDDECDLDINDIIELMCTNKIDHAIFEKLIKTGPTHPIYEFFADLSGPESIFIYETLSFWIESSEDTDRYVLWLFNCHHNFSRLTSWCRALYVKKYDLLDSLICCIKHRQSIEKILETILSRLPSEFMYPPFFVSMMMRLLKQASGNREEEMIITLERIAEDDDSFIKGKALRRRARLIRLLRNEIRTLRFRTYLKAISGLEKTSLDYDTIRMIAAKTIKAGPQEELDFGRALEKRLWRRNRSRV